MKKLKQLYAMIACALVFLTSCTYEYKYPETSNYVRSLKIEIGYGTKEALAKEAKAVIQQYFNGVEFYYTNWKEEVYFYDKHNQIVSNESNCEIVKVEAVLSYQGKINYQSDWIDICAFHFVKTFDNTGVIPPAQGVSDNRIIFTESSPHTLTYPTQSIYRIINWSDRIFEPILKQYGCSSYGYGSYEIFITEKDKDGNIVRKEKEIRLNQAIQRAANTSYIEVAFKLQGYDNGSHSRKHVLTCKLKRRISVDKAGIINISPMEDDEYDVQPFVGARYQFSGVLSKLINADLESNGYNSYYYSFKFMVTELDEKKQVVNQLQLDNYSYNSKWFRATENAKFLQVALEVTASKKSSYATQIALKYSFTDLFVLKNPREITQIDLLSAAHTKQIY